MTDEIKPQQPTPAELLVQWDNAKKALEKVELVINGHKFVGVKAAAEYEMAMRKVVFAAHFPAPTEGANTVPLQAEWKLTGTQKIEREVDQPTLEQLKKTTVAQLADTLKAFGLDPAEFPQDMPVLMALGIVPDVLLEYKPKLKVALYKSMTVENQKVFGLCLTEKVGSPTLEIKAPKISAAVPKLPITTSNA